MQTEAVKATEAQQEKKFNPKNLWLYAVFLLLMIFTLSQKAYYFQDEILSFCLANNQETEVKMTHLSPRVVGNITGMKVMHGIPYVPSSAAYERLTSVPADARFDYANVWRNQANDTHPPFYYTLLHTVCSFFPGQFSKWFGGFVNFIFALLTLFIIRQLVKQFSKDKFVLLAVSLVYIFSSAILNSTSFLRMYVTAAFWVTLQTYLFIKQTGKPITRKFCIQSFFVTLATALTHYYCILYLILLSVLFGIYMLIDRDFKGVVGFSVSQCLAGGCAMLIFPAMYTHIFHGARGTEFMANAVYVSDFGQRLAAYWQILSTHLFGGLFIVFAVAMLFFEIYKRWIDKDDKEKDTLPKIDFRKYSLIVFPCVFYFMSLAKIAPILSEYSLADIKYLYVIFTQLLAFEAIFIFTEITNLVKGKASRWIIIFVAVLMTVGSWHYTSWKDFYLYRGYNEYLSVKEQYSDTDCICFYINLIPKDLYELSCYRSLTIYPFSQFNPQGMRQFLASRNISKIAICISTQNGMNTDAVMATLAPEINNYNVSKVPLGYQAVSPKDLDGAIYHLTRVRW